MTLEQLKSRIVNKKILVATDLLEFKLVVSDGTPVNELVDVNDNEIGVIIPNNCIIVSHNDENGNDYYHILKDNGCELFNIFIIT